MRLLQPKGLAMTQKRWFASVSSYRNFKNPSAGGYYSEATRLYPPMADGILTYLHARSRFGETRRSIPSFAKATEGYPFRIHPRVYTRGFLRRRVNFVPGIRAGTIIN